MDVVLDNLRSIYNVGSIFRTADALNITKLYLCGTTPHPHSEASWRKDHMALTKTALGAEKTVAWEYHEDTLELIPQLKQSGHLLLGLEIDPAGIALTTYQLPTNKDKIVLIVGNEVDGLSQELLALCDQIVTIPMHGSKESLNVAVSFGIAAFWFLNTK